MPPSLLPAAALMRLQQQIAERPYHRTEASDNKGAADAPRHLSGAPPPPSDRRVTDGEQDDGDESGGDSKKRRWFWWALLAVVLCVFGAVFALHMASHREEEEHEN